MIKSLFALLLLTQLASANSLEMQVKCPQLKKECLDQAVRGDGTLPFGTNKAGGDGDLPFKKFAAEGDGTLPF